MSGELFRPSSCFDCGVAIWPGDADTYLGAVRHDDGNVWEEWWCGACMQQLIQDLFFEPVAEGEDDRWFGIADK